MSYVRGVSYLAKVVIAKDSLLTLVWYVLHIREVMIFMPTVSFIHDIFACSLACAAVLYDTIPPEWSGREGASRV